jgi:hypothetical protein
MFKDLVDQTSHIQMNTTNQSLSTNCFQRISFHMRRIYGLILMITLINFIPFVSRVYFERHVNYYFLKYMK